MLDVNVPNVITIGIVAILAVAIFRMVSNKTGIASGAV